jgi:hypothetical protein
MLANYDREEDYIMTSKLENILLFEIYSIKEAPINIYGHSLATFSSLNVIGSKFDNSIETYSRE